MIFTAAADSSWLNTKCYEETNYEVAGVLREPGNPPLRLTANCRRFSPAGCSRREYSR
jgi:hypothetical protein